MRGSEDWKKSSQKAAELWTASVETIESYKDAKRALEAYYHYIEISDFEYAASILVKGRKIKWSKQKKSESLGRSLYKLGILKETISAIVTVINRLKIGYPLCRLYNILGDAYWLTGNIREAISCHQNSRRIAIECLNSEKLKSEYPHFFYLKVISYFNIGNCQINLWEVEDAIESFRATIQFAKTINDLKLVARASCCLAFLLSCLGSREEASLIIENTHKEIETSEWGVWSKGHTLFFLGCTYKYLGRIEASYETYNRAMSVVENSFYFAIKAKALNGLGELSREENLFSEAIPRHSEAISIMEEIGMKCDLAEAYYQRGLTYQAMGEIKESCQDFQEAIRLFIEIQAPKQVDRVRRSMENNI